MTTRTRVLFCDLLNLPRGKYVPVDVAAGGKIGFARGVFGTTYDRDLIPVPGAGVFDGIPDMDLENLVITSPRFAVNVVKVSA